MLFAVGIEGVGCVTGRNLAAQFRTIDALLDASAEQIAETPGIGPKVGELIHAQLADEQMRALLADLRELGLKLEQEGPPPGRGPAARPHVRAHRLAARPHPRGGDRADPRPGRQGHRLGVEEDQLRGGRRLARAPSWRRPSGSASPCSTRPGCSSCWSNGPPAR